MNAIRVKRVSEFKGEDIVLLAMDHAGLDTFLAALTQAEQRIVATAAPRKGFTTSSSRPAPPTSSWMTIAWCGG